MRLAQAARASELNTDGDGSLGARSQDDVGCSCGLSEPHLRSQFAAAAEGTPIEDALLDVTFSEETLNAEASDVVLTHVEVADPPL